MSSNARQLGELATAGIGKNVIINGNFDIWQRGTSFTSTPNNTITADRWVWFQIGSGVVDSSRSTLTPDEGSEHTYLVTTTTADASIAATDQYYLHYTAVEGYDAYRLSYGDSNAKTATLSFWVRSSVTGTYSVAFRNSDADRSLIAEYSINSADTWEYKTITIPGDTTGTWLKTNNEGLLISFSLAIGSNKTTSTIGSWQAGNYLGSNNQVNFMGATSRSIRFSRIQFEVGSAATEFERRHFSHELRLCERYFEKSSSSTLLSSFPGAGANAYVTWTYRVEKRATPTVTEGAGTVKDSTHHSDTTEHSVFKLATHARIGGGSTADAEF